MPRFFDGPQAMEASQVKIRIDDLAERTAALRRYL